MVYYTFILSTGAWVIIAHSTNYVEYHHQHDNPDGSCHDMQIFGPIDIPRKSKGTLFKLACGCQYNNVISYITHYVLDEYEATHPIHSL